MQIFDPILPLFSTIRVGKEQGVRAESEKAIYTKLVSVDGIIYHWTAYPRKVAAYLMAETTLKPYGESVIFVICNIDNLGTVIAAAVFRNLIAGGFSAFAVVGYRADLFPAGAEGVEKTFNCTTCKRW